MNIDLSQFSTVVAALMIVGAIIKHAVPQFPSRFIPLISLVLGQLCYLAMTDGWGAPSRWIEALVAAATATGVHSGIKNIFQELQAPKE